MTMDEIEAALEYQQGQIVALNLAVGRVGVLCSNVR